MRFLLLLAALPAIAAAQAPSSTTDVPRAIRLITEADLRRDLFAMASPEMRGREGGTLDELRASIWVAQRYAKIGLQPAGENGTWFQWFNLTRTRVSVPASRAIIAGKPMTLFEDIVPLSVVPVEAAGRVLWLSDPADTTLDIRGRIVAAGKAAILEFGQTVARFGGCPLAEHGVGRNPVKQQLLQQLYGERGIEQMRAVKRALDPDWKLAPGVIFLR